MTAALIIPENISIIPLPAKCPELNPVKNIWQFIRDNWLSNRIFESYNEIVDHCCDAWNKLIGQPARGLRPLLAERVGGGADEHRLVEGDGDAASRKYDDGVVRWIREGDSGCDDRGDDVDLVALADQ